MRRWIRCAQERTRMSAGCSVTDISWERVHLTLTVVMPAPENQAAIQFMLVDGWRRYPVDATPVGDSAYRLDINITNFTDRGQIPDGTWRVVAFIDGEVEVDEFGDLVEVGHVADFDLTKIGRLEEDS